MGGNKVGQHPTDRGKLGATRRLRIEGGGGPIGLAVARAQRHDFKRVRETIESIPVKWPAPTPATPQGPCLDTGDADDEGRDLRAACGFTAHLRARRWVVERTPSGMTRFRRVLIRWDNNVRNYPGVLHFACADLTSRPSGLLGEALKRTWQINLCTDSIPPLPLN
jgi:hypothetical protein